MAFVAIVTLTLDQSVNYQGHEGARKPLETKSFHHIEALVRGIVHGEIRGQRNSGADGTFPVTSLNRNLERSADPHTLRRFAAAP